MTPLVVSSHLPGAEPLRSDRYDVHPVECAGEFSYWAGLDAVWGSDRVLVNVEHDMEFSDDLVAGLVDCPHPLCAYPYLVYPTALQRFIFCASQDRRRGWITDGDDWADWSSIGFVKIAPEVRDPRLCRMFWQWLEHSVHYAITGPYRWHIHWPAIAHHHDYTTTPDHLW